MEAAYIAVNLWAQAVAKAGTAEPAAVREAVRHQSFDAPEGLVSVDYENLHTWKVARLGQVKASGQFDGLLELRHDPPRALSGIAAGAGLGCLP